MSIGRAEVDFRPQDKLPPPSHVVNVAIALIAAIGVHHRSLHTFFAQDDITFLLRAARGLPHPGIARSLSSGLAFRVEHAAFGLEPLGFHAVNLALHILNVAGVYALCFRLTKRSLTSTAAAILFGASSIAFTPLHWATGIVEVLTATLLIAATLIHLESDGRHRLWSWSAATVALPAMLSKETAIGWIGALALAGLRGQRHTSPVRRLLPAAVVTVGFVAAFVAIGPELDTARSGAYALSAAPGVLMANFSTYVHWSLAIWNPIRARSCHACSPARSR